MEKQAQQPKFFERRTPNEQQAAANGTEQPAAPAQEGMTPPPPQATVPVRAQIVITLLHDGGMQVDGPWGDRVLFHGMLQIAADVERMEAGKRVNAMMRAVQARAKESRLQRWVRERNEKKAAQQRAKRDELAKALQQNT